MIFLIKKKNSRKITIKFEKRGGATSGGRWCNLAPPPTEAPLTF